MERSDELVRLVAAWFDAASRGDTSMVERHTSREAEARLIGSDADEWLAGPAVVDFLHAGATASAGNATFTPLEIEAFVEGSVGWAATRLKITLANGRSVTPRWSAVFHRESDEWKIIQAHASIAVANDDAGWEYS